MSCHNYHHINRHIKDGDINSALEECLNNEFYYLGTLIGRITGSGNSKFHSLLGRLHERKENLETISKQIENNTSSLATKEPSLVSSEIKQPSLVSNSLVSEKPECKENGKIENKLNGKIEQLNGKIKKEIRKEIGKEIKIKLLCNWASSRDLSNLWNKMTENNDYRWENIRLVWDEEVPDYFVVLNAPPINEFPDLEKTILFHMEPYMKEHPEWWGLWSNPDSNALFKMFTHSNAYNNVEWHLSKTYKQLSEETVQKRPEFNFIVSTVLSAKYRDVGHIKRIDFVKFLEKKGLPVHVYGDNKWLYKDYRGSLPYHNKDEGLFPYKYTFNCENNSIANYFTEKLVDGILAECLVFYSGCYNVKEYIDERAFVYLSLDDFEKDYETIKQAIKDNLWEKRLPYIREAKKKILNELQFFPRLEKIINGN